MVIKDKVAAAVYVDATELDLSRLDPTSIELLVFTTGLLIDTMAIRKKTPSPSLNDPEPAESPRPAPAASPRAATPAPPPRPAAPPPPPPTRPAPIAEPAPGATVAVSSDQLREMMTPSAKPAFSMPETDFGVPSSTAAFATTAIPAIEPPRPAPPPPPPPAHEREERPSTQYIPPPNVTRGGTPIPGGPGDDSKKHDEARRFARLLVSEIKLYNEPKVEAGRKNKDLYERLKEDIDRSRQMYDELVRILADGHADALGL
jgi:hypothetical protein